MITVLSFVIWAYLLSTCYVPSTALGTRDTAVSETDKAPTLMTWQSRAFGGGTKKEYVRSS